MKLIKLHSKSTETVYKNQICSLAAVAVFLIFAATCVIPLLLVLWVSPTWALGRSAEIFEQPDLQFEHNFLFIGDTAAEGMITCSTFPYFNALTVQQQKCRGFKFWQEDSNYDHRMDKASFELKVDTIDEVPLKSFEFVLFFEATLQHRCILKPPAVLIQHLEIPDRFLPNSEITIQARLQLVQEIHFVCPFYGRALKTYFRNEILLPNASRADNFLIEKIRDEAKANPAYFESEIVHINFRKRSSDGIKIIFNLEVVEVSSRYHLNIWEQLGHFWLYFSSFFAVACYIASKIKNFLFSRHLLRSWEIIPWKKLH